MGNTSTPSPVVKQTNYDVNRPSLLVVDRTPLRARSNQSAWATSASDRQGRVIRSLTPYLASPPFRRVRRDRGTAARNRTAVMSLDTSVWQLDTEIICPIAIRCTNDTADCGLLHLCCISG